MVSTAVNFDLNNGVLAEKIIMVQEASTYGYKRATFIVLKLTINQSAIQA
jgi:hypothetical protein